MGPLPSQWILSQIIISLNWRLVLSPPNKKKMSLGCQGLSLWLLPEADL